MTQTKLKTPNECFFFLLYYNYIYIFAVIMGEKTNICPSNPKIMTL